ncbi:DUF4249 domain-containing protein [Pontibacter sp. MBLB2868]|uniref:DUF4249 domain-containing protein n=1 Tax=Pontibacter sp. MBLB2868 TaxID=3451555 RepID=UPI003F74CF66
MKLKTLSYLFIPLLLLLASCDLEKDIEVNLPEYEPQLVVECYLQPGKPFRLTLMESSGYFETPQPALVSDADVYITHNGRRIKLSYKPMLSKTSNLFHTHSSTEKMQGKPGDIFGLEITDKKGRKVTGFTTILPAVPIDTIEWKFNEKNKAYLLTTFQDNAATKDFYRYVTHRDSLHTDPERAFVTSDNLTNGKRTSFGSAYDYERGDTLLITLYHIEKQYYDFLSSTADAKNANGNPFAQPSSIKSSVQGGIGIFTNLAYDRRKVIIE